MWSTGGSIAKRPYALHLRTGSGAECVESLTADSFDVGQVHAANATPGTHHQE
jgi:hypothetical protein